jgi:hypothetical protein
MSSKKVFKKKKFKKLRSAPRELSPNAMICPMGLIEVYKHSYRNQLDTHTFLLMSEFVETSSVAGVLNDIYSNDPSGAALAQWTSLAAVFDEYRVLCMEICFVPYTFNGGLVTQGPIATCIDYDNASALTSYGQAASYSSFREYAGGKGFFVKAWMDGAEDAKFVDCAAPTFSFVVKLYSTGNTASTTVGRVRIYNLVQFRGKGL